MQTLEHKQGDTLRASVVFRNKTTQVGVDMHEKTVTVRTRGKGGIKLKGFNIAIIDANIGLFRMTATAADTKLWPVGLAEISLTIADVDGGVTSTKTIGLNILQRI